VLSLRNAPRAGKKNVSAVSQRIAEISAEITLVSHHLSALPQQLSCLSERRYDPGRFESIPTGEPRGGPEDR